MRCRKLATLLVGFVLCLRSRTDASLLAQNIPRTPFPVSHPPISFRLPGSLLVADGGHCKEPEQDETRMLLRGAVSGAIAGSLTQLFLHPIDTVKTRLQIRGLSALRLRPSNLKQLYAGVTSNVLGEAPSSALFYATYETLVRKISPRVDDDKRSLVHLSAAAMASVVSSVIRVPSEVVKTQLQTGKVRGNRETVLRILRAPSGWRGLFVGYRPFLLRDVPFDAIQFMTYEALRFHYLRTVCADRSPLSIEDAALGSAAGGIAGAVTTPFDVVRAELMVSGMAGGPGSKYTRMGEVVVDIIRKEGAAGLMRGVWARVGWLACGGFIFFPALEGSKSLLRSLGGDGEARHVTHAH